MEDIEITAQATPPAGSKMTEATRYSASKDHVYCELEGEAVILSLRDGIYYGLNAVGLRIWELIQTPQSMDEILDTLTAEYEVERAQCQGDVTGLLDELIAKGLVEVAGAQSS